MFDLVRRLMGISDPQRLKDGPAIEAQQFGQRSEESPLYHGMSVPPEASNDPHESSFSCSLGEHYAAVPANDKKSLLVFCVYLTTVSADGTASYNFDTMRHDHTEYPARLEYARRIHEHLLRDREPHPRIVRYLGPTSTGYRVERLYDTGPLIPCEGTDDVYLALHQRWALQMLSALQWMHERGVTLAGAIVENNIWLREDFSLAIPGFMTAGCLELDIPADHWPSSHRTSPWGVQASGHAEPPFEWCDTGTPKGDVYDWATWVFGLMSGGEEPLGYGLRDVDGRFRHFLQMLRDSAAEKGEFDGWPGLSDDLLGPVLVKAWKGGYESAADALEDARQCLVRCGRTLTSGAQDEIDGFNWQALFEIGDRGQVELAPTVKEQTTDEKDALLVDLSPTSLQNEKLIDI